MTYEFNLYIAGQSAVAQSAMKNLKELCSEHLSVDYKITVIDVLKEPRMAEDDKVIATPTVMKKSPLPVRKIMGDLSDKAKAVEILGIPKPLD